MQCVCVCVCIHYLEEPGEDVKLKDRDVVVAGEVYGGLKGHGLQSRADGMKLMERLSEHLPRHNGPAPHKTKMTTSSCKIKHQNIKIMRVECRLPACCLMAYPQVSAVKV